MTTHTELAGDLFTIVGRFRRELRRCTDGGFDRNGLTQSQAELLRLVGRRPDISVREAADELGLAANTASTLVSRLAADEHLIRSVDPNDRRIGRLRLGDAAQESADRSRQARRTVLADALNSLDDTQIEHLTQGLAVIAELTQILQESRT